jgi:hypothetical protein
MLLIPLLILIFILGLEITIILGVKVSLLERLSLSFLLGIGFSTFTVFLLAAMFNLNFNLINTFAVLTSLCVISFMFKFKGIISFFKNIKLRKVKISSKMAIFWGFILSIFAYTLLVNSFWPVSDWDALALYDFRAKVFLIDTNLIHAAFANGYFVQDPLLTSLAHLFVYQVGLGNPKFIYSLFYLSFIIIFYYSLKRNVSENKAILFTVILALVPEILTHATMAYTNLAYTVYLCSGIFYLYDWIRNREHSSIFLSAVLVGLSSWVRIAEPFWLIPFLVAIIIFIKKKKWKEFVYYPAIILTLYLPWKLFMDYVNRIISPVSNATGLDYLGILREVNAERILLVVNYLYKYVFSTWGLIFLLFLLVVIKAVTNLKRDNNIFLYITLFSFIFFFAGALIFSITYPGWQNIPESARRTSIFIIPMIIFSISLQT